MLVNSAVSVVGLGLSEGDGVETDESALAKFSKVQCRDVIDRCALCFEVSVGVLGR